MWRGDGASGGVECARRRRDDEGAPEQVGSSCGEASDRSTDWGGWGFAVVTAARRRELEAGGSWMVARAEMERAGEG